MAVAKSINQTVTRHIIIILVIVLTRPDPALQYLSLLFVCCFFWLGFLLTVLQFFRYVVTELRLSTLVSVILDIKILQLYKM